MEPGPRLYQSLGHCALRLESTDHQLDYCFTFEADSGDGLMDYLRFFAARARGRWVAVPSTEYFADYRSEQRTVAEYDLPLGDEAIRLLWQRLDEAVASGHTHRFDFLTHNCTQGILQMLDPSIVITETPAMARLDNDQLARHDTRRSPWMQFIVTALLGTEADRTWTARQRAVPERLPLMLTINGQSLQRIGNGNKFEENNELNESYEFSSPIAVFSLLLIVALLSLDCDRRGRHRRLTRTFDALLFTLQTATFALLLWLTEGTSLFTAPDGSSPANLYLLPLAPVPLLLLLTQRMLPRRDRADARPATHRAFALYTLVLVLFIAATPLSSQLCLSHQLVTATLAVRSLSYALYIYPKPRTT